MSVYSGSGSLPDLLVPSCTVQTSSTSEDSNYLSYKPPVQASSRKIDFDSGPSADSDMSFSDFNSPIISVSTTTLGPNLIASDIDPSTVYPALNSATLEGNDNVFSSETLFPTLLPSEVFSDTLTPLLPNPLKYSLS